MDIQQLNGIFNDAMEPWRNDFMKVMESSPYLVSTLKDEHEVRVLYSVFGQGFVSGLDFFKRKPEPRKITKVCQCCANSYSYSENEFETIGIKELWTHVYRDHRSLYDEVAAMSDSEMLDECYKD